MGRLNISKVAVACASFEALRKRQLLRARDGVVPVVTRFRPKRADELIGGSLYWIIKHRIVARNAILGFGEDAEANKTIIRLEPKLVPVRAVPKRAHQGWRYLTQADAPTDFALDDAEAEALPPALVSELTALALL